MEQLPATSDEERQPETHSTESSEILRNWLAIFSEHYGKPVSELSAVAYARGLSDLTAEQIDRACEQCLKVCRFMPTVADIRAQIDQAEELDLECEAEDAWQQLLDALKWTETPILSPAADHSARAAGGLRWIESCPLSELQWAKKRFVEDYLRVHRSGQIEHLLLSSKARETLARLVCGPNEPPKRLPAETMQEADPARRERAEAWHAVLDKFTFPRSPVPLELSQEECDRRKAEQKQRLEKWLAVHAEEGQQEPKEAAEKV